MSLVHPDHDDLREVRTRWFGDEVVVDTLDGRLVTVYGVEGASRDRAAAGVHEAADAAYLSVSDVEFDHPKKLDDARGVNYPADGSVIGNELLSPRRKGVLLDGLPYRDDVERVIRSVGFPCPARHRLRKTPPSPQAFRPRPAGFATGRISPS